MALNPLLKGLLQKTNQGFQAADDFLGTRGGNFALNLLAQQGFSTMPQSPIAAVGRAGLATQQQEQEAGMNDAQRRLIESQIGLNTARTLDPTLGNPTGRNVARTFVTNDGRLGFLRRDGEMEVTDQDVSDTYSIQSRPDGSQFAVNRNDPTDILDVLSSDDASQAAVQAAQTQRDAAAGAGGTELNITRLESQLDRIDSAISDLEEGNLNTGPIAGNFAGLTSAGQRLRQLSGENVLDLISQATFGALSEGERRFLTQITFNLRNNEDVNIEQLQQFRAVVQKALDIERGRGSRLGISDPDNDLTPEEQAELEELRRRARDRS